MVNGVWMCDYSAGLQEELKSSKQAQGSQNWNE
jgi:hypothetical protein